MPVIAIAGDVETMLMDTSSLEEMNPYQFFQAASLYTARLVNPAHGRLLLHSRRGD
jgi:pyruvate dehydrogenase (quinone)